MRLLPISRQGARALLRGFKNRPRAGIGAAQAALSWLTDAGMLCAFQEVRRIARENMAGARERLRSSRAEIRTRTDQLKPMQAKLRVFSDEVRVPNRHNANCYAMCTGLHGADKPPFRRIR